MISFTRGASAIIGLWASSVFVPQGSTLLESVLMTAFAFIGGSALGLELKVTLAPIPASTVVLKQSVAANSDDPDDGGGPYGHHI
jgi:hypothetical protein